MPTGCGQQPPATGIGQHGGELKRYTGRHGDEGTAQHGDGGHMGCCGGGGGGGGPAPRIGGRIGGTITGTTRRLRKHTQYVQLRASNARIAAISVRIHPAPREHDGHTLPLIKAF